MKTKGLIRTMVFMILGFVLVMAVLSPSAIAAQGFADGAAPPLDPVAIPDPITVILFAAGLAALSASVAVQYRQE